MTPSDVSVVGGSLAILTLGHFVFDWLIQTHDDAMVKSKSAFVRAGHCLQYAIFMTFTCSWVFGMWANEWWVGMGAFAWLFATHFFIDSYKPVWWWVKYCRRPPFNVVFDPNTFAVREMSDEEKFKTFTSTPLGLVLAIVVDQIFHVMCLIPPAFFAFVK